MNKEKDSRKLTKMQVLDMFLKHYGLTMVKTSIEDEYYYGRRYVSWCMARSNDRLASPDECIYVWGYPMEHIEKINLHYILLMHAHGDSLPYVLDALMKHIRWLMLWNHLMVWPHKDGKIDYDSFDMDRFHDIENLENGRTKKARNILFGCKSLEEAAIRLDLAKMGEFDV